RALVLRQKKRPTFATAGDRRQSADSRNHARALNDSVRFGQRRHALAPVGRRSERVRCRPAVTAFIGNRPRLARAALEIELHAVLPAERTVVLPEHCLERLQAAGSGIIGDIAVSLAAPAPAVLIDVKLVDRLARDPLAPLELHVAERKADVVAARRAEREALALAVNDARELLQENGEILPAQTPPELDIEVLL